MSTRAHCSVHRERAIPPAPPTAHIPVPVPSDERTLPMDRSANTGSVGARPRSAAYPDPSNPRPMSHKGLEVNGQELGLELATGDRKEILQNGDESIMEKGSMLNNRRVNKDRGPSAKEQQVVDRLLGQGPKILFVSLKKTGADELYNAVPTSQKDRVCVYLINGERSLVKWANTINEYEAIDREISIVSTRRWFHDVETQGQLEGDLSQSFDSNFELDAPATLEEADSGPNDHDRSGSAVDCADGRGVGIAVPFQLGIPATLARDPLATLDFEGTLLEGLGGQIAAKDDSLSQSPSTPATLDIRPPEDPDSLSTPIPSPNHPTTGTSSTDHLNSQPWLFVVVVSATSAALGGLLAWGILAYEPYGVPLDIRMFLAPLKLGLAWLLFNAARGVLHTAQGFGSIIGPLSSCLKSIVLSITRGFLRTFQLVLEVVIVWLNHLHDRTLAYSNN